MKVKVILAAAGFAFLSLNASAQSETKTKVKVKTETPAEENAQGTPQKSPEPIAPGQDKAGGKGADKAIPIAQYYEGGQAAMYEFINKNIQYPPMAKRNRIQGQCIVSVTLNPDGTTTNMRILKNMGAGTGEEALRVVRLLKFNAPGYSVQSSVPVNFKL
ncbi:energy transducer TonB [Adhaeribacter sp. BT258]|uniref:Energy transducer TonB n=1 Tax=Adhaeribacter terrigena TaxID=2793070 RepID=A0ABS1BYV6_9BACT|nr:energy transducer TonB [Adhaeribacter terrigena]MBK0402097.1 energy transducer TonB [Adhaeribacter terrigena]